MLPIILLPPSKIDGSLQMSSILMKQNKHKNLPIIPLGGPKG